MLRGCISSNVSGPTYLAGDGGVITFCMGDGGDAQCWTRRSDTGAYVAGKARRRSWVTSRADARAAFRRSI